MHLMHRIAAVEGQVGWAPILNGRALSSEGKQESKRGQINWWLGRSGSPNVGKGCEKPARKELTRFEGAKLRAKQRLGGWERPAQKNGQGLKESEC
eukprot:SM000005S17221  [mRNA]  locus=s5:853510:853859:- [translate_table: standard]